MSTPLEDYALLSDLRTGPLVSREGSIDWLCLPRFDSPPVFTALLGGPDDGRWSLRVEDGEVVERRYLPHTFVLETTWRGPDGVARVTDFLTPRTDQGDLVRRVECLEGQVTMTHDLRLRFDFARATPWIRSLDRSAEGHCFLALAGPDALLITGPGFELQHDKDTDGTDSDGTDRDDTDSDQTDTDESASEHPGGNYGRSAAEKGRPPRLIGQVDLQAGEHADWDLTWFPSHEDLPHPPDADQAFAETVEFWTGWTSQLTLSEPYQAEVLRSLLVLRALTHADTGGIVAAPTTSLPEAFGGSRNWDYRYVWLRDAAFTIEVAVSHGLTEGAAVWRDWLLRAVAGDVADIKIMYGLSGERDLPERELDHLAGYEDSLPVRIGNAAVDQYQADVVGEVMIALHQLRAAGIEEDDYTWGLQKSLLRYCEANLDRKDHGIWEMRGDAHYFTHGRVMMWAAFDRGIAAVEEHGLDGPVDTWRDLRERLAAEIEEHGFDADLNSYTQTYGSDEVDASLLQLPHAGYLDYDDPRMLGTVARIEEQLVTDGGLVHRYRTDSGLDGLDGDEAPFLICAFWLAEQYARSGRLADSERLMDQLLGFAGELGLLAEEYDEDHSRLAGNFPQAFSHIGLIRAADAICAAHRTPEHEKGQQR